MADHCKYCDIKIEWAITAKGSRIPLDIGSYPDANIVVDDHGIAQFVAPGKGVRISHFVTCPSIKPARRRGGRR